MTGLLRLTCYWFQLYSFRRNKPHGLFIGVLLVCARRRQSLVIALLLSPSLSPIASAYEVCPGIQSGVLENQDIKAAYSHCVIDGYGVGSYLYPTLYFDVGLNIVGVTAPSSIDLDPAPSGMLKLGALDDRGLENVGAGYAGNCEEVTATGASTAGQDGDTYCGWYANVGNASRLLLKATLVNGAFSNVSFAYDVPVTAGDAAPVPTMPIYLSVAIAGLLGLFALRRLQH